MVHRRPGRGSLPVILHQVDVGSVQGPKGERPVRPLSAKNTVITWWY